MSRPSIALRLALGLAAGMALLWIGAGAISVGVMQHELNEAYDDSLRQSAQRLLPLAVHDLRERNGGRHFVVGEDYSDGDEGSDDGGEDSDDGTSAPFPASTPVAGTDAPHDPTFTYLIRNRQGEMVLRDEKAPSDAVDPVQDGFGQLNGQRTFAMTDPRSGFSILIVETSNRRLTALRDSAVALGLPLLALLPLIVGGVWLAMRLALRPLKLLRHDIAQRDSRNLEPLNSKGHPSELAPIVDAVGDLLVRLKSALDAERSFAARSAHELRTPIAGALAQTQQLAAELANGPGSARVAEIESALKKLSKLSEKLLQMARIEAGFAQTDGKVDQLPALRMVIRDVNSMSNWRDRVELENSGQTSLPAPIDPDAFAIVMRNLIENALKHGAPDHPVQVIVTPDGLVRVRNAGNVVGPESLARLGQPFVRGATSSDGSGLGLSIARTILEQAGGGLILTSPIPNQTAGFEATATLPRPVA